MTNVFLVPGGEEEGHLRSIRDGVSINLIKDVLKDEERERLERIYGDGWVRVWGTETTRKMRSIWERMEEGDILLFAPKGSGRYRYYGEVAFTSHNRELAKKLQGLVWRKGGEKYECIFYVKNLREIDIPKETINKLAGYEGLRVPIFLTRVRSPESVKKIIDFLSTGTQPPSPKFKVGNEVIHKTHGRVKIVSMEFKEGKWVYTLEKVKD